MADAPADRITLVPCPMQGCDKGIFVLSRVRVNGDKVVGGPCVYCAGTGLVSAERKAAYHYLIGHDKNKKKRV